MIRILFVDDEPIVLRATERMVRTRHPTWQPAYVTSGAAALAALAERPFDVIVSDIGMPELDGVSLLALVAERFPSVIRFALSGDARSDARSRAVSVVHQWFSKPCVLKDLMQRIERVAHAASLVTDAAARRTLTQLGCLPSAMDPVPGTDPAVTAKILQLANGSFFGEVTPTASMTEAARRLGSDRISSLLARGVLGTPTLRVTTAHAVAVSQRARAAAAPEQADAAATAGLLHDLAALTVVTDPLSQARQSGYLLALWGLPEVIVQAVTYQRDPANAPDPTCPVLRTLADAVAVACAG